jgi:hypothetical protein
MVLKHGPPTPTSFLFQKKKKKEKKEEEAKKKRAWDEKKIYILVARVWFSFSVQRDPFIAL